MSAILQKVFLSAPKVGAITARPLPSDPALGQILVICAFGVCPLEGACDGSELADVVLAPPLALTGAAAGYVKDACDATYDPHSDSVIVAVPRALLAISAAGDVSIIAGDPAKSETGLQADGAGDDASFGRLVSVAAGRSGMLYALDHTESAVALRRAQRCGALCYVSTVHEYHIDKGDHAPRALSYNRRTDELLLGANAYMHPESDARVQGLKRLVAPNAMELIAGGADSNQPWPREAVAAPDAFFTRIQFMSADRSGNLYILDGSSLRVLTADGKISYLEHRLWSYRVSEEAWPEYYYWFRDDNVPGSVAALPGGLVALWVRGDDTVQLLQLERQAEALGDEAAASGSSAAAAAACGGRKRPHSSLLTGLTADMGALLDGRLGEDPDAAGFTAADVTLVAGGEGGGEARSFPAHRFILGVRCPYFRRLFAGGFADSAAPRVELPETEPEALAAVLRHLYTGDPGDLAEGLLRPVAELADRLLLPELRDHVAARLVRSVTPGTVVDGMLWADRVGKPLEGLLRRLVAYFTKHRAEVAAQEPGGLDRLLAGASPALLKQLVMRGARQS
ncbi:hypothetical protein GPECTOR_145g745 [Gonium pectorale]|uniref:BTB domain-containing protein n=1 Tax=Gonium pectorale TaxID=33097 RepID=A0A150FXU9_GONPE|nr:hypothetical protein GPECTOR_145g745 [Gonium pectorale]|eukprot:KXZ42454.1 hypothetical protein GPECTOR_145g745 [Gonium pectorale]